MWQGARSPREPSPAYAVIDSSLRISSCGVRISRLWCGRMLLYNSTAFLVCSLTSPMLLSSVSKSQPFFTVLFILSASALCKGSPLRVMLILILKEFSKAT